MMLSEKQTARRAGRPSIGLLLPAGCIAVPPAAAAVRVEVGGGSGRGPTFALIILAAGGGRSGL
ncbi:MAG TPA: hypothetical protein VFV80_12665 [Geminicoccaceae bacterium]|nr:hypothetical protein [Geminicoccaceae bacterium]